MTELDRALHAIAEDVRRAHLLGVKISVRCDGRVSIEVFRDSLFGPIGEADVHPEALRDGAKKPSEILPVLFKKAERGPKK